jgi:hypothetical protein
MTPHSSNIKKLGEIISAFVDGEATSEELNTLQEIADKPDIQNRIQSEIQLKQRVRNSCQSSRVSSDLFNRCLSIVENGGTLPDKKAEEIRFNYKSLFPGSGNMLQSYLRLAAAAMIIIGLLSLGVIGTGSVFVKENTSFSVEAHVFEHFNQHDSIQLVTHSTSEAHSYIAQSYNMNITVPELKGAVFAGIAYSEFVPGFRTPVLMYHLDGQVDPVMIFAFNIPTMSDKINLIRDDMAIRTCVHPDSVHIKDIAGRHVVSWKWDDTWYAGISYHQGEVLASMLPINR